jgi:sugar lactone lactonase YvrE
LAAKLSFAIRAIRPIHRFPKFSANFPRNLAPGFTHYLSERTKKQTKEKQNRGATMKTKLTETKFKSALGRAGQLFSGAACLGAIILICSSASAQNLFRSDGLRGSWYNPGHVYELTPCGATGCVVQKIFASGLNGPEGLTFDSAGILYVADEASGNIYKYTQNGARGAFASGLTSPMGLALDGAGNLFVTDESSGTIYKFNPTGARTTFVSGLSGPRGLAFNSIGNLFVACVGDGNIYEFKPTGLRGTFATGLSSPYALAFDSAGNLYVTGTVTVDSSSSGGGYVYKYTWDGLRSTFATLGAPLGLAFDSAGILYVADEDSGNIYKYKPNGVRSTFAEGVIGMHETGFLAFQPMAVCCSE